MKSEFSGLDFLKISEYQISLKSLQWELSCPMRMDGGTGMNQLIVAFRNFAKALDNQLHFLGCREVIIRLHVAVIKI
jgi:hypothetical protein